MIKSIIYKFLNRETISYLIFGILTTAVNYTAYELCRFANMKYTVATVIAWILAVAFAFITNKLYVFNSKSFEKSVLFKEITTFVTSRLLSGIFDLLFMVIAVGMYSMNDSISKLCSNVFVVIINYILSKMFVFKNSKKER